MAHCYDCKLEYGSSGWLDCIVSDDIWIRISPTGDEGGILCINCIAKRCDSLGLLDVPVAIQSGALVAGAVTHIRPIKVEPLPIPD